MSKLLIIILPAIFLFGCAAQKETIKSNNNRNHIIDDLISDSTNEPLNRFIDGSIEEAKGNYAAAIEDYKEVLKMDPKPSVYYAIAKDYYYLNKLSQALPYSKKAIKLDSSNVDYFDLLSEIYSDANQNDSSAAVLNKMISMDSTNINAYYRLARIYETNKPSKAIDIYNNITNIIGPDWNVLMHVAQLQASLGNFDGAAKAIQKLLTIDPSNAGLQKLLAEYYQQAKKYDEALKVIDDVLAANPDDLDAYERKAQIYLAQNKWDLAANEYNYIMKQPKAPFDLKIRIGASYFEQSFKDSTLISIAKKFFTTLDKDTTFWQVKMYLGAIAIDEKNDSTAIEYFKDATHLASWNVEAWVRLGGLYFDNKKYDDAAKVMQEAVKSFPEDFRVNFILGISLAQNNHNTEAKPYLQKAVELNPNSIDALSAYGFTLSQLKENKEAIEYLKKALLISPNDVNLLGTLGLIYDGEKRWSECDSVYEKALSIDSTSDLINNNYAYSLSERGIKLDLALRMAQKAIVSKPNTPSYLDTIGWIYFKMGNYKEAKNYIEQAIKLDSSKPDVLEHLGDVEYRMGNKNKAKEVWQKALSLDKNNNELKQKIEKGEI